MSERGEAIVLIGFMGAGKSSVGRELVKRTGLPLYDTDRMVAARVGMPIAEIFASYGEEEFRDCEAAALAQVAERPAIVVTGGGLVLRTANVEAIRRLGSVINLVASEEALFERVSRRGTRPLLQTSDPRGTLSELLRKREPLYRAAADFTIDTTNLTHAAVAEAVLRGVAEMHQHVG